MIMYPNKEITDIIIEWRQKNCPHPDKNAIIDAIERGQEKNRPSSISRESIPEFLIKDFIMKDFNKSKSEVLEYIKKNFNNDKKLLAKLKKLDY